MTERNSYPPRNITKIDGNFAYVVDNNDLIYFAFKNKEKNFFVRYIIEKKYGIKNENDFLKNTEYEVRKASTPKPMGCKRYKEVRIGKFSGMMNNENKRNELVFTSNILDGQWKIRENNQSSTGFILMRIL
jgi:hypothetical protein